MRRWLPYPSLEVVERSFTNLSGICSFVGEKERKKKHTKLPTKTRQKLAEKEVTPLFIFPRSTRI